MPRKYVRKPGTRRYADYTEEKLQECLDEVRSGALSHRKAEEKYNIPRRTILNKLKKRYARKPGGQPVFSTQEEEDFVQCIIALGEFGFPVDTQEVRHIIKDYLDRCGRTVRIFLNNLPGLEWANLFITRHPELSLRFAENVKRTRAAVDETMLRSFFENLATELQDVSSRNVWNFDETNLTDDPGKKKVLVKKGCKYPEFIRNASKTSISVMFAGNAAGELLPPYVVYRASNMWTTWTENGPRGSRYNASSSGWFDSNIFTDWLEFQMMPRLKRLEGKKVLICDNLSSHLTVHSLRLCRENQVSLICLPPNSTHLTQPLDVAFFRPVKIAWRNVLSEWKGTEDGIKNTNIQKQNFPPLLAKMMGIIEPSIKDNLISGFRKCGIFPLNVEEVLTRIPSTSHNKDIVESAFLKVLDTRRSLSTSIKNNRRKKMNIPPGKSVCADEPIDEPMITEGTEQRDEETLTFNDNSSDDVDFEELEKEQEKESKFINFVEGIDQKKESFDKVVKEVERFVVFSYEGQLYPGQIVSFNNDEVQIKSMQKSLKMWKWPLKPDELTYSWSDVMGSIKPPKQVTKRGIFSVPELACWYSD